MNLDELIKSKPIYYYLKFGDQNQITIIKSHPIGEFGFMNHIQRCINCQLSNTLYIWINY